MGPTCSETTQPNAAQPVVGAVPQRFTPPAPRRPPLQRAENTSGHQRTVRQAPLPVLGTRLVHSCSHIPAQFLGRDQSGFQVQCQRVYNRTNPERVNVFTPVMRPSGEFLWATNYPRPPHLPRSCWPTRTGWLSASGRTGCRPSACRPHLPTAAARRCRRSSTRDRPPSSYNRLQREGPSAPGAAQPAHAPHRRHFFGSYN